MKEISNTILRSLDDVDCTNVVVSRQIRKFIRKFPSFKDMPMTCYTHGAQFDAFKLAGDKFVWSGRTHNCFNSQNISVSSADDSLCKDELNRLIVSTFRTMCELNSDEDVSDTPEDLLEYAEMKLREMLNDESNIESDN